MFALTVLLGICSSLASARDYRLKTTPSVTHSIVNLGKMEFNVYLNSKAVPESQTNEVQMIHESKLLPGLRSESAECPCQQNRYKNRNQDIHGPSDMLSKILMNDDLFSFKDPMSSPLCCQSHEVEIVMEYNPKAGPQSLPMRQNNPVFPRGAQILQNIPPMPVLSMDRSIPKPMQFLPLIFDAINTNKGLPREDSKTFELIMFPPKKMEIKPALTQQTASDLKSYIQIVGNKKTTMVYDLLAANSSVKKDLKQEVGEHLKNMDAMADTDKTTSAVQNNTL